MSKQGNDRAVFITGASTGIGREAAVQLDALGFQVFGTVRKQEDADSLSKAGSGNITPVMMDVTDQTSIEKAAAFVNEQVGERGLFGLLNNAGVGIGGALEFIPLDNVRWLYDVNVFGLLAVTQAFVPMIRRAKGRIVNVSSLASDVVTPFHGTYGSAKCAVNGLSDALRLELAPLGVRVSMVLPGNVITAIWENARTYNRDIVQGYPDAFWQIYGKNFEKFIKYVGKGEQTGIPVEKAGRQTIRAFTDKRPRIRYYVGPDARLLSKVARFTGYRFQDWLKMRMLNQR